ncbi:PREDICTED: uncharacterized protein LOC109580423 isoform X1 [Amphimedon queenslandica]|uniref:Uncharacterized protein n=2 Tax=Amphimedon queenslandica TaxID=400682 RepID=A0AAN0IXA1_AMPQE|nr:PREDICTED: uncharacterized protein LOC109580423 isoform X1 [Amphimedon queenslandica]|eukprot:XP_019849076.1 PREDICTED: uncharacterized protein LOC109580423 isoform X1 [Amphimedon queenslandica]
MRKGFESDLLLDSPNRRQRNEKSRSIIVTSFSLFLFLLYALALVMILVSIGFFTVTDGNVRSWIRSKSNFTESNKTDSDSDSNCILHSSYDEDDEKQYKFGKNAFCYLNYAGEALMGFICLALLVISIFQAWYGKWNCCFVTFNMIMLLAALLMGIALGYNLLLGHISLCSRSNPDDTHNPCNEMDLLLLSGGALLVAYASLCIAIVLELLMMLCHLSTRKQNQRQGLPKSDRGYPWIDETVLMGRERPKQFD